MVISHDEIHVIFVMLITQPNKITQNTITHIYMHICTHSIDIFVLGLLQAVAEKYQNALH